MKKNIEVELRALVPDIDTFRTHLVERGAKFIDSSYLCDIYFCKKDITSINEVEMHDVGSYSLRLRVARKDEVESITLNIKVITNENDHHAWEEHEVETDNFGEAAKLLTMTEFKPFFKLEKYRHAYELNGMEILVEDITDFGGAVEVEILCDLGEETESKEKIKDLLVNTLGLQESDIVPKSVTNIVMKERAFKQEIVFD